MCQVVKVNILNYCFPVFRSKVQESSSDCQGDPVVSPLKCDFCDRIFMYKSHKVQHEFIHSELRQFSCGICGKAFKSRRTLTSHSDVHNENLYKCTECCFGNKRKQLLKVHMIKGSHSCRRDGGKCLQHLYSPPGKVFNCIVCGTKFSHLESLQVHYNSVHKQEKAKHVKAPGLPKIRPAFLEVCHICGNGRKFSCKTSLKRHMKIHLNVKEFKCGICQKEFRENYNLKRHMREIHSIGVKPSEQGTSASVQNCSDLGASQGG